MRLAGPSAAPASPLRVGEVAERRRVPGAADDGDPLEALLLRGADAPGACAPRAALPRRRAASCPSRSAVIASRMPSKRPAACRAAARSGAPTTARGRRSPPPRPAARVGSSRGEAEACFRSSVGASVATALVIASSPPHRLSPALLRVALAPRLLRLSARADRLRQVHEPHGHACARARSGSPATPARSAANG